MPAHIHLAGDWQLPEIAPEKEFKFVFLSKNGIVEESMESKFAGVALKPGT